MRSKTLVAASLSLVVLLSACGLSTAESTPAATETPAETSYISIDDLDISECVESVTYKGLSADKQADTALTDAEFDYALYLLLSQYATTEQITDRTVQDGDTINLDYIAEKDGTLVTDFWQDGAEITVGGGATFAEFEDALVGRPCGEEFTVEVTLPESLSADYGGEAVQVMVEINYIESEPEIPELTDEFAASLEDWDCATADEFRVAYRTYLTEKKAAYYDTQYKDALWDQVMASAVITDTGEAYIASYCRQQLDDCRAYAESLDITLGDLAVNNGYDDEAALLKAVNESAMEEAETILVMRYIANAEGLAYTDDAYYDAVDDYAVSEGFETTSDMINAYGLNYVEETVGNGLLYDLVRDYVADNAA